MASDHVIAHRVRRAYRPGRVWLWDWKPWRWRFFKGSDEYFRHTYVLGFIVIAGKSCCGCECMRRWQR